MLHDELIERRGRRNHHRTGSSVSATGATGPLPSGSDRPCISGHHAGVQRANVDAQFQGVGGYDTANSPRAQTALDFAPLAGKIPATIAANRFRFSRLWTV